MYGVWKNDPVEKYYFLPALGVVSLSYSATVLKKIQFYKV
jgi:hypothetical protein